LKIESRLDIQFLKIGIDGDHVHFLIQSIPTNFSKKSLGYTQKLKGFYR
jgi:REP element-mobilizing transposase RayT